LDGDALAGVGERHLLRRLWLVARRSLWTAKPYSRGRIAYGAPKGPHLAGRFIGWATPKSIATLFAKLAPYGHEG
jgi:hypothetical protein